MSKEQDKFKKSKRILKDENAVKKQVKIAKSKGTFNQTNIEQPHRLAKRHAMDCGNPHCFLCGNPRKTHKDKLTVQEKKMFQDTEEHRDRHSNGTLPEDE